MNVYIHNFRVSGTLLTILRYLKLKQIIVMFVPLVKKILVVEIKILEPDTRQCCANSIGIFIGVRPT